MVDVVATFFVVVLGSVFLVARMRAFTEAERPYLIASFLMHLGGAAANLFMGFVVYRGVVDWIGFDHAANIIARALTDDPVGVFPQTVLLFLHQDSVLSVPLPLTSEGGRTTVSMWILATWGKVMFGGSFIATFVACSIFSFFGKSAMYEAFRDSFAPGLRPWLAVGTMLVPSLVFWTAGLVKEGVALAGLGFATLGLRRLIDRNPVGLLPLVLGVTFLGISKPWALIPLSAASVTWYYLHRATAGGEQLEVRPLSLVFAAAGLVVFVFGVGKMFPAYDISTMGERVATMQGYGRVALGGSSYLLGDPSERSVFGQLRFAPIALFTALYRPLIFEARNPQMLVNAFETTAFLVMSVAVLWRQGWRWVATLVLRSPTLGFCIAFWLPAALGAGLVSNNLGTLSRYRSPMVPFLAVFLLVLYAAPVGAARTGYRPERSRGDDEPEPESQRGLARV